MKPITTILLSLIVLVLSCKVSEPETVKSTKKEITSLQISGIANATTTYDEPTKTYTITVPTGTNIKALTLALNLPTGATSVPATGSVLDFTNPIVCTITAEDGSTQKYTIRVVVQAAPKSSQKQLLSFSFDELNPVVKATINQTTFEITAEIPATANLKALKPNITLSDKASVSPTSGAAQDFTNAVKYTVTAEDGSKQEYAVTVKQVNQSTSTQIWDKAFGGSGSDGLGSMIATPDGGFLLGGGSRSRTSGNKTATNYGDFDNTNCWVVKINANGEMVWDKAFGGSGYNGDFLRSMIATSDGGFLLGGDFGSGTSTKYGDSDYWVVKINANGEKVWDKAFGGNGSDQLSSMIATSDGGFLLGGGSISPISGNKTATKYGSYDYWVVKINANGEKVWDKAFGGSDGDNLTSMIATSDGGFLLGGNSVSPISGNKTATNYGVSNCWVVKINANGDKVWDKAFGGSGYNGDFLRSMIATSDGGFLLGGDFGSGTSTKYGDSDYWVVKINANGEKVWDKTFGGIIKNLLNSMIATSDGGFLLGGSSDSPISGNKTAGKYGSYDYWVVKINANGEKVWDKAFGGSDGDFLSSMIATSDGGFLLGGYSFSPISGNKTATNYGDSDYWVVKIK